MAGRRRSRYDIDIVEHEVVADPGAPGVAASPPVPLPASMDAAGASVAHTMLESMHRELENMLRAEMRAVEVALETHTRDLEGQLRNVLADIERIQAEKLALQQHPVHALHEAAKSRLGLGA